MENTINDCDEAHKIDYESGFSDGYDAGLIKGYDTSYYYGCKDTLLNIKEFIEIELKKLKDVE